MMEEADNKGRDAIAQLQKEAAERAVINAERAQEEATKGLPPVVPLGFMEDAKTVAYYARTRREVVKLKPSEHKAEFLLMMADISEWASWLFPDKDEEWIEDHEAKIWKEARVQLMAAARVAGRFDAEKLRKIGIWEEVVEGKPGLMFNAGNACFFLPMTGGAPVKVDCLQERHIYAADKAMPAPADEPLSYEDGLRLVEYLSARQWEVAGSGELVAGWIVNSLLAGVAERRPHLWITAPAETGKTVLHDDVAAILGDTAVLLEGASTSEAGMRQKLAGYARPVLFDELEGDGVDNKKIEDGALKIMRTAYASEAGAITKGGEDGTPREYPVRCGVMCFSVLPALEKATDKSRCLNLRMVPLPMDKRREIWASQEEGRSMVTQDDFTGRLIHRVMVEWQHIRENIKTLREHLKDELGARRAELIAHLMAGCYALTHGGAVDAAALAHALDVAQAYEETEEKACEEMECLAVILDTLAPYDGIPGKTSARRLCQDVSVGGAEEKAAADRALASRGMRWRTDGQERLQIQGSPAHEGIKELLAGTRWASGQIVRVIGAGCVGSNPNAYGIKVSTAKKPKESKKVCRVILIPASLIFPEDGEE